MTDPEQQALIALAHAAMTARVSGGVAASPSVGRPLADPGAAFVTLRRHAKLRGCVGHTERDCSLAEVVMRCAASAATDDPRFPSVTLDELVTVAVEISVLTPLERVSEFETIVVGRDGLMVSSGVRRGVLLPQVAVEFGWDRDAFLRQTCLKAGLEPDAWNTGACVFRFEAEIFGEVG